MGRRLILPNRAIRAGQTCQRFALLVLFVAFFGCSLARLQLDAGEPTGLAAGNEISRPPPLGAPSSRFASNQTSSNEIDNAPANKSYVGELPNQTGGNSPTKTGYGAPTNAPPTTDVDNLQLLPDRRSVKLRWSHWAAPSGPSVFRIRYCELTSWSAEIKCRQRNYRVAAATVGGLTSQPGEIGRPADVGPSRRHHDDQDLAVIASADSGDADRRHRHRADFETQIYDLRALTNYTFQVQALAGGADAAADKRLDDDGRPSRPGARSIQLEPPTDEGPPTGSWSQPHEGRPTQPAGPLAKRVETKPFGAEAAKCLANSSEISVQTGKYFGGRISVESANSSKCQLAGNRSSEQSTYLLRIDHEVCRSKVVDGNRIETMILVHENKDILTHNSARFLVVCSFSHQSFTVKASVSLPKINSLAPAAAARPATITRLKSGPAGHQQQQRLRVGTMPVVYSAIQTSTTQTSRETTGDDDDNRRQPTTVADRRHLIDGSLAAAESTVSVLQVARPSPSNRSVDDGHAGAEATTSFNQSQRQAKQLLKADGSPPSRVRGSVQQVLQPSPVEVGSKSLMFEPAGESSRGARLLELPAASPNATKQYLVVASRLRPASNAGLSLRGASTGGATDASGADESLIMTNNHRVAGDFPALASHKQLRQDQAQGVIELPARGDGDQVGFLGRANGDEQAGFSIKYSPNEVSEYSLDRLLDSPEVGNLTRRPVSRGRARSGRLLHAAGDDEPQPRPAAPSSSFIVDGASLAQRLHKGQQHLEQRMGDQVTVGDLVLAESRPALDKGPPMDGLDHAPQGPVKPVASPPPAEHDDDDDDDDNQKQTSTRGDAEINFGGHQTLAQNITSALFRLSVRTLGNWVRKSLESLAVDESNSTSSNPFATTLAPPAHGLGLRATLLPPNYATKPTVRPASKSSPLARQEPAASQQQQADEPEPNGFLVHSRSFSGELIPNEARRGHQHRVLAVQGPATFPPAQDRRTEGSQRGHRLIEAATSTSEASPISRRRDHARPQKLPPDRLATSGPGGDDADLPAAANLGPLYVVIASSMILISVICALAYHSSSRLRVALASLGRPATSRARVEPLENDARPGGATTRAGGPFGDYDAPSRAHHPANLCVGPRTRICSPLYSDASCRSPRGSTTSESPLTSSQQSNRKTQEFIFTDHVLAAGRPNESFA